MQSRSSDYIPNIVSCHAVLELVYSLYTLNRLTQHSLLAIFLPMQLCVVIALGAAAGRLSSPCCVRSLNFIHFMMMRFVTAIININGKCRRTTIEPVHLVLSFQMCVSWCCFSAQQLLENVFASFFRLTFNLDPFLFMRRSLYCKLRNKLCSMNEWMGIKNFCWVGGWWTRDRIIKMKQKGPWNSIGLYRRAAAAFALALAFAHAQAEESLSQYIAVSWRARGAV